AVMDAGLHLTSFVEHDSTAWEAFPGQMTLDAATGEWRLIDRPERLPATFTLTATKP
ncbi:MAG TPA: SAM-dependent methyltransferase, partial [Propionibacteriaceae bacterium]|nr:SAM-dependent methyltransferase [Propionibacteriaceae bacterium]